MPTMRRLLLPIGLTLTLVGGSAGAQELQGARDERREAEARLDAVAGDFEALARRYVAVQERANAAAGRLVDAYLRESELEAHAASSRALLDDRADAIYRAGPAAFVDVLLGSSDPRDFLARQEMIEGALSADVDEAVEAVAAREEAEDLRRQLEADRRELVRLQEELTRIRTLMEIRLAEAYADVEAADARVRELRAQRRELMQAAAMEQTFTRLVAAGTDQTELLALLGSEGGRGCAIPDGLEPTGQMIAGEASFYGEEFAGNPTATGAIFNPELFTAAHLTLPLPSFLHVRYGGACATVLVNDRGPYVDGRVLDLSEGAARYLGLPGVGDVEAEILAPR